MSFLEFLTAVEYWKQSEMILADTSMMARTLAAAERPSMMQDSGFEDEFAVTHPCTVKTHSFKAAPMV